MIGQQLDQVGVLPDPAGVLDHLPAGARLRDDRKFLAIDDDLLDLSTTGLIKHLL